MTRAETSLITRLITDPRAYRIDRARRVVVGPEFYPRDEEDGTAPHDLYPVALDLFARGAIAIDDAGALTLVSEWRAAVGYAR